MVDIPGKINTVTELSEELHMVVSRLNYDALPEEFCRTVRNTQIHLSELVMRRQIERRQPHHLIGNGAITIGDKVHDVVVRQVLYHGFSVISTFWVKEGEVLSLRLPQDDVTREYPCAVVGCRRGGRPDDNGTAYYLMLEKLYDSYVEVS
ncbi:MAG: hypothetical protein ACR2RB_18320 [Gammaproteobacteria bacterium]